MRGASRDHHSPIGFSHDLLIIMPNSMEQRFEKAGQSFSCPA
jgi:hypothetical protein